MIKCKMPVTANTVHVTTRDEVVERTKTACAMFIGFLLFYKTYHVELKRDMYCIISTICVNCQ